MTFVGFRIIQPIKAVYGCTRLVLNTILIFIGYYYYWMHFNLSEVLESRY